MSDAVYDGDDRRALAVKAAGFRVLCPRCGAELVVAIDIETARKFGVHPGIHCPVNLKHVSVFFNLASVSEGADRIIKKKE